MSVENVFESRILESDDWKREHSARTENESATTTLNLYFGTHSAFQLDHLAP